MFNKKNIASLYSNQGCAESAFAFNSLHSFPETPPEVTE